MHRALLLVGFGLVVVVSSIATTGGSPNPSSPERNGLTETERATLWSGDSDTGVTDGEGLSALANETDITFYRPPATARIWSRNDFSDYKPGDETTSVVPEGATTADSWVIRDAHVTTFTLFPSTVAHVNATTERRYVAPEGMLLAAIDYRIEAPANDTTGNRTETWTISDHEIGKIRLETGQTDLARAHGTHTPMLSYELSGPGLRTLTLTAEIEAELERTVTTRSADGGESNESETKTVTLETDSLSVRDRIPVSVYAPTVTVRRATFPDGSSASQFAASQPWQGVSTEDSTASIRTNWRFYTARDDGWDQFERRTADRTRETRSPARPVLVHAYPSQGGVRALPYDTGPVITSVRGVDETAPNRTIDPDVDVDVVQGRYTSAQQMVVRSRGTSPNWAHLHGIVNGTRTRLTEPDEPRRIRRSRLTMTVLGGRDRGATLRLELRDEETGAPLILQRETRREEQVERDDSPRHGFITVAGQRVRPNESGVALVRIQRPGVFTARYHPESWATHEPAYAGDTAVARWHPLTTVGGWVSFGLDLVLGFVPLLGALYVGRHLGRVFVQPDRRSGRR